MSGILVVYFSRTGKTRAVAGKLAELLGAEIEEIRGTRNYSGVLGFLRGVLDAMRKRTGKLASRHSTEGKKTVIVATPVWANGLPPAVRAYLRGADLSGRRACALATHGGGGARKTFKAIAQLLPTELCETIEFKKPNADDPELAAKLKDWAEKVKNLSE